MNEGEGKKHPFSVKGAVVEAAARGKEAARASLYTLAAYGAKSGIEDVNAPFLNWAGPIAALLAAAGAAYTVAALFGVRLHLPNKHE